MKRGALLLSAGFAICLSIPARAQTMEERARSAAAAARTKTGDSDALQSHYLTPGLAGQPISTIDNSKSFTPNIACQKTATLLELLAQPTSTGDIGTLRISRDKDLDGAFDETLNVPVPVSGICANGIISCAPGSWNACRPFQWEVGSDGALKLGEVDLTELAGCYCINNSCGTNLAWGNMASILKDLGGGVVGALTTADPRIGVAQAAIDGPVIRYTGAQTTACSANPSVTATAYRGNPTPIQGDAYATSRSSSVFQALAGSPAATGKAEQTRRCTIERQVSLQEVTADNIIARVSGGYATYNPAPDRVSFVMGSPTGDSLSGGSCTLFDQRMILDVKDPDRLRSVVLSQYYMDDWIQIRVDGRLILSDPASWTGNSYPPARCERSKTWYGTPALDLKPLLTKGQHEISLRIAVGNKGESYARIDAVLDTSCKISEQLVDLCSGTATDPACHLVNETVDGVETFRNGVNSGLKPLAQTRLFGTGGCTWQITRDFFTRARQYSCQVDLGSAAEPDLSRGAYIIDRSTETLLADRTTDANGTVATSTRPFSLPERGSVAACEPICKTRAPRTNSDVAVDGVVGSRQNDPAGWDIFYHSCTSDHVCPLGQGEELVSACGCLDDFPEAVVMMQTVRLAGADLACTAEAR
ncbi:hypothetical protein [Sphingobium estronivorans]|uniref:hypothetical protein n=1 Tax=Sphingobium estronivorans TaxID=1577690 RepID=UPI00123A4511|nr:hypothetical protein [Sphingobium estronivorans]